MKIVINNNYGGYGLGVNAEHRKLVAKYENDRSNLELVALVENNHIGDLVVVEIPDTATDWDIDEYDGLETVIYVLNGRICYTEEPEIDDEDDEDDEDQGRRKRRPTEN